MRIPYFAVLLLTITTASCAGGKLTGSSPESSEPQPRYDNVASNTAPAATPARQSSDDQVTLTQAATSQEAPVATERKIIRNADMQIECDVPTDVQQKVEAIAQSYGGFVVESQQSMSDERAATRDIVTITMRVPAEKFGAAIEDVRKTGNRVISETIKGQDVTEEFIDVEARLKAKKALEEQFMEIMKRANTVGEALDVQRQLGDVRAEIEKIEGRKRFLENQASLSTIKIRLQTPAALAHSSSGFGYRLMEALATGFDFALSFVLGLVTLLIALIPFALFICLPIYLGIRYFWRKRKRSYSVTQIAEDELGKQ
jgi:hypothetical protein